MTRQEELEAIKELMICSKWQICEIDCADKLPHEKELACNIECDWDGICIPYVFPDVESDIELDGRVHKNI